MNKKIEDAKLWLKNNYAPGRTYEYIKIIIAECERLEKMITSETYIDIKMVEELKDSYQRLEKENGENKYRADAFESSYKDLNEYCDELTEKNNKIHCQNNKLQRVVACVEEALTFYATAQNWEGNVVDVGVGNIQEPESSEVAYDHGEIARQAIADYKKETK